MEQTTKSQVNNVKIFPMKLLKEASLIIEHREFVKFILDDGIGNEDGDELYIYEALRHMTEKFQYLEHKETRIQDISRFNRFMEEIPNDQFIWDWEAEKIGIGFRFNQRMESYAKELLRKDQEFYPSSNLESIDVNNECPPSFGWGFRMKRSVVECINKNKIESFKNIIKTYKVYKVKQNWKNIGNSSENVKTKVISLIGKKMKIQYYFYSSAYKRGGEINIYLEDKFGYDKIYSFKAKGFKK